MAERNVDFEAIERIEAECDALVESMGCSDPDEAVFEVFFTDRFWELKAERMRVIQEAYTEGAMGAMSEQLIQAIGTKPSYLTELPKKFLHEWYFELLREAREWAEEPCSCGGEMQGFVAVAPAKYKAAVGCNECGAEWY